MSIDLDMPPFRPRLPWINSDLQTLANTLSSPDLTLGAKSSTPMVLPLNDGTDDALQCTLDTPTQERGGPLVALIHGAGGEENSRHVRRSARLLLSLGYRVLRMNLRGAGRSKGECKDIYNGGSSQELRTAFSTLDADLTRNGVFAVGYSLGGAILLKYLGEDGDHARLIGAAAVSAPIDLSATTKKLMRWRNYFYHADVLRDMQEQAGACRGLDEAGKDVIHKARSLWEFDDGFTAAAHGFVGAEDYYDKCKAVRFMPSVRKPTLTISAADDSWVPVEVYRGFDWAANPALTPLLPPGGGHVGFHAADDDVPWHDRAIIRFVERIAP